MTWGSNPSPLHGKQVSVVPLHHGLSKNFASFSAIGSYNRIISLVILWQIFMMVYIVFLFILWIIGPYTLVFLISYPAPKT